MGKKRRFIFLSSEFYNEYPSNKYPEIEQKPDRPYVQVYVEVDGVKMAIPLRSNINHPYVLWTDKKNKCGIDFSKAVVIRKENYIDNDRIPYIRQKEFDALRGKDYKIKEKMKKYIEKYEFARNHQDKEINRTLVYCSTLQYFEDELGITK